MRRTSIGLSVSLLAMLGWAGAWAADGGGREELAAAREAFAAAQTSADQAQTGAEGLAVWEDFLAKHGDGPLAEQARREQAAWKERADKNLARYGPGWAPKDEVDKRNAEADELLAKADGEIDLDAALKIYDQASKAHPYRGDIQMRAVVRCYKAGKLREAGLAWGDVVKADPDNAAARNNLGVLAACQRNWGGAFSNMARAAVAADDDRIWDNLDLAVATAEGAGMADSLIASAERQIQTAVTSVRRAGKHLDQTRWGNSWISLAAYQGYMKENDSIEREIAAGRGKLSDMDRRYRANEKEIKSLDSQVNRLTSTSHVRSVKTVEEANRDAQKVHDLQDKADKLKSENAGVKQSFEKLRRDLETRRGQKKKPTHAARFVLLAADGKSELASVDPSKGPTKPSPARRGGGLFD